MVDLPAPLRPIKPTFFAGFDVQIKAVEERFACFVGEIDVIKLDFASGDFSAAGLAACRGWCVVLDRVAMPSLTVPMFSNNRADSHMMYCDKPFTRNAMAVAVATAPTPTWP